jgi:hypothetical protein
MNRRKLLLLLVLASMATFGYVRLATHDTPAEQARLAYLDSTSLAALKADFNEASNETRIIVLLSPT